MKSTVSDKGNKERRWILYMINMWEIGCGNYISFFRMNVLKRVVQINRYDFISPERRYPKIFMEQECFTAMFQFEHLPD